MKTLYDLNLNILVYSIMIISISLLAQMGVLIYSFLMLKYKKINMASMLPDLAIFADMIMFLYVTTIAHYNKFSEVYLPEYFSTTANVLLILNIIAAVICFVYNRKLFVFLIPTAYFFTLPLFEDFMQKSYPATVFSVILFFSIKAFFNIFEYQKVMENSLSPFSLKDAIDSLNFGLLLFNAEGPSKGEIFLCNSIMRKLQFELIGEFMYNGQVFYNRLMSNQVRPEYKRNESEKFPIFTLSDGQIFQFKIAYIGENPHCALISASNITEYRKATTLLYNKNRILKERNVELKIMLENLDYLCRQEELVRIKGRVHDLLGHKISIMLRDLREQKFPDQDELVKFSESIINELRYTHSDRRYDLEMLAKDFESLGVKVFVEGTLPEDEELDRIFFETAFEAVSNSVRHGYASEIHIRCISDGKNIKMTVSDNGVSTDAPIIEGEGFKGMRRKAEENGGSFSFSTDPVFTICISVPQGGNYYD